MRRHTRSGNPEVKRQKDQRKLKFPTHTSCSIFGYLFQILTGENTTRCSPVVIFGSGFLPLRELLSPYLTRTTEPTSEGLQPPSFFPKNNVETNIFQKICCEIFRGNMLKVVFVSLATPPPPPSKFRSAVPVWLHCSSPSTLPYKEMNTSRDAQVSIIRALVLIDSTRNILLFAVWNTKKFESYLVS